MSLTTLKNLFWVTETCKKFKTLYSKFQPVYLNDNVGMVFRGKYFNKAYKNRVFCTTNNFIPRDFVCKNGLNVTKFNPIVNVMR